MRVHNHTPDRMKLLTKQQWAEQGRLPNDDAKGKEMWTNRHCNKSLIYYEISETHIATDKELATYKREITENKRKRARERYKKHKQKLANREQAREREISEMNKHIQELETELDNIKHNYNAKAYYIAELYGETISKLYIADQHYNIIVIDIETTGLDTWNDEILQLSIIDGNSNILYNEYFRPLTVTDWLDAQAINSISPHMISNSPRIYEELHKIIPIIRSANTVVCYHSEFVLTFLHHVGITVTDPTKVYDVMTAFAPIYADYNEYWNDYMWKTLTTAAKYYSYDWGNDVPHNSLADCKAILHCYHKLTTT